MNDEQRYHAAAHAMQSGVAFSQDKRDQSPKHLRVGINTAHSDISALAALLIEKGVFTREEYIKALADAMEREAENYRQKIAAETGADPDHITLA